MEDARQRLRTASGRITTFRERGNRNRANAVRTVNVGSQAVLKTGSERCSANKVLPREIMDPLRVSGDKGIIGVMKLIDKMFHEVSEEHRRHLVRFVKKIIVKVVNYFLPNDGLALLFSSMEQLGYRGPISENISDVLVACGPRTIERETSDSCRNRLGYLGLLTLAVYLHKIDRTYLHKLNMVQKRLKTKTKTNRTATARMKLTVLMMRVEMMITVLTTGTERL